MLKPKGKVFNIKHRLLPPKVRRWVSSDQQSNYVNILKYNHINQDLIALPGNLARQDMLKRFSFIQHSCFLGEYHHTFIKEKLHVFHPLLEYRMVSLAYSLRPDLHIENGVFKNILRGSLDKVGPSEILNFKTKLRNDDFYSNVVRSITSNFNPMHEWKIFTDGYADLAEIDWYKDKGLFLHVFCHEKFLQNYSN